MPRFALQFPAEDVPELGARFSYGKSDDDCLAAGAAARARGSYTRDELILICAWKTDRSKSRVGTNTETEVEFATARAFRADDEGKRIEALTSLTGVGVPTASALLGQKARTIYPTHYWTDYLLACRRIAGELGVPIRTLDKALWQASKERTPDAGLTT